MRRDEGSVLPLTIFYSILSLALILVVVATTSLYLERKRLFSLADAAALVGAEAFSLGSVQGTASGYQPTVSSADVAVAVTTYLAGIPDPGFESLTVERAESDDGRSASVTLSALWRPPVLDILAPKGVRIKVTARARSGFG